MNSRTLPSDVQAQQGEQNRSREVAERAVRLAKGRGSWESASGRYSLPTWAESAETFERGHSTEAHKGKPRSDG